MKDIIEYIKNKYSKQTKIHIVYEDQPVNHFKTLFLRMHGLKPGPLCLKDYSGVYISAVGTEFYQQCVPNNSIDFGISTIAFHWLSKLPCPLTDTVFHRNTTVNDERQMWKHQAAKDCETILLHRSRELVPGGKMVIASACVANNHESLPMYKTFDDILLKMKMHNQISCMEYKNTNICYYLRTIEEFTAPWNEPDTRVRKAGLVLEYIKLQCPSTDVANVLSQGNLDVDNVNAARKTACIRKWLNSTIFNGLSESRSLKERNAIVDEFFRLFEAAIEADPECCSIKYSFVCIQISKNM